MIRTSIFLLSVAGLAALSGCSGYSIPVKSSDLTHDAGHSVSEATQEDTVRRIQESLAKEMTPQSTVQDGYRWFDRHGVPIESDRHADAREIYGGFIPFWTQGFWAATDVIVQLKFDEHGKYQRGDVRWTASAL